MPSACIAPCAIAASQAAWRMRTLNLNRRTPPQVWSLTRSGRLHCENARRRMVGASPRYSSTRITGAGGGHPLVAELITRRNLADANTVAAFLNPDLYTPADPLDLPDLAIAADRLDLAIQRGEKIAVWGDFDVDGQTSTALLVSGLRSLGADVIYHIPVRARESHGINLPNLQKLLDQGAQLILTCDTGITAHEAAEYLQSRKIDLLITDHHTLPDELPPAPAVINPQRLPPDHPPAPLCAVWVRRISLCRTLPPSRSTG